MLRLAMAAVILACAWKATATQPPKPKKTERRMAPAPSGHPQAPNPTACYPTK